MALSKQFSLSVELTKLVPLAPLAKVASGGLLSLLRQYRDEGFDPVTEEDLAMVFGRNKIESKFESTFRTAVRQSTVHKISDIAELMLEAGAGPTVRRSLKEPVYFSTVVQLSLLTWTHGLNSLARGLAQALDRRAKGSTESTVPPRYNALKDTLRAYREQTSGFMWELIISAVDRQLSAFRPDNSAGTWFEYRPMPLCVLQALLDAFTAVQHLPDATLVRIVTFTGVSTIVVWAHHILGLTVLVEARQKRIKFGQGQESVYINAEQQKEGQTTAASAALVNETRDLLFEVENSLEDLPLQAASRHPISGYGLWMIEFEIQEPNAIRDLVYTTVVSCLHLVEEMWQGAHHDSESSHRGKNIYPSAKRIVQVAETLFPGYCDGLQGQAEDYNNQHSSSLQPNDLSKQVYSTLVKYAQWSQDSSFDKNIRGALSKLSHLLAHIVLVLAVTENIDKYPALSIDLNVLKKERYMPFRLPDATEAFKSLIALLGGREDPYSDQDVIRASAISCWGWCICLGSIIGDDPSSLFPSLAVLQGVPRREGERKRLIVDGHTSEVFHPNQKAMSETYDISACPGDRMTLESWTRQGKTRYFIAATDNQFEVVKVYTSHSVTDPAATKSTSIGFRGMQNTYWDLVHLPACDHPVRENGTILPEDTWAFRGFGRPDVRQGGPNKAIDYTRCMNGSTHVALTAGDTSARWIMLAGEKYTPHHGETTPEDREILRPYSAHYVRNPDCCLECAINQVTNYRRGRHVGLIL